MHAEEIGHTVRLLRLAKDALILAKGSRGAQHLTGAEQHHIDHVIIATQEAIDATTHLLAR